MNEHPTQEQWMEFLYQEADPKQMSTIRRHLQACATCRTTQEQFQQVRASLDTWRVTIPEKHRFPSRWAPIVRWAAAAAILVTTAFATARVSQPDPRAIEARVETAIQQKVAAHFESKVEEMLAAQQQQVAQLMQTVAMLREEDQKVIFESLRELQVQQAMELHRLRQNLETVAVLTDQSLKSAQRKLVQLASYTSPKSPDSH